MLPVNSMNSTVLNHLHYYVPTCVDVRRVERNVLLYGIWQKIAAVATSATQLCFQNTHFPDGICRNVTKKAETSAMSQKQFSISTIYNI